MSLDKLTDPKSFGPGLWLHIHSKARRATDDRKMRAFAEDMQEIVADIKCNECRGHATKYLAEHPIEENFLLTEEEDGVEVNIGCFFWTWNFHNAVNARLRKPIVDWETAKSLFQLGEARSDVCTEDCGKASLKKRRPLAARIYGL